MLRLGKFTEAIERGDERRSSLRKENAGLYADFVRDNPGASVDERTDYAQTLINDTGVGSRGLPTKSAMIKKVDAYKKEQAQKAAATAAAAEAKKRSRLIQNLKLQGELIDLGADQGWTEEQMKAQYESLGIDPTGVSGAMTSVGRKQFQTWQQDHQASIANYLKNPTKAAYDLLVTQGGEKFERQIKGLFSTQYTAAYQTSAKDLRRKLEDASLAGDTAAFDREIRILKDQFPDDVWKLVGEDFQRAGEIFKKNEEGRTTSAVDALGREMETLSQNIDQSPEEFKRARESLRSKYTPEQLAAFDAKAGDTYPDAFTTGVASAQAVTDAAFNQNNMFELEELANAEDTNRAQMLREIQFRKDTAVRDGVSLPADFGKSELAVFDANQLKRDNVTDANNLRTVDQRIVTQEETVSQAVRMESDFDSLVAEIERNVSGTEVGDVKLTEGQKEKLKERFDQASDQLTKDMKDHALNISETSAGYDDAVAKTKAEFVARFVSNLESTQGISNVNDRFGSYAEKAYDDIIAKVRMEKNDGEAQSARDALTALAEERKPIGFEFAGDVFDGLLKSESVLGAIDKDEQGAVFADIKNNLLQTAGRFARQMDLPISQDTYREMASILADGEQLAGTTFPPERVKAALVKAFQSTLNSSPHPDIEYAAYVDAMDAAGIDDLATADDEQMSVFRNEYGKLRVQLAEAKFDIYGDSFADDIARSAPLISRASGISTTADPKLQLISNSLASVGNLSGLDLLRYEMGDIKSVMKDTWKMKPDLEASIEEAEDEIIRLTKLTNTPIYKTSEHAPAVKSRIAELSGIVDRNKNSLSMMVQIRAMMAQFKSDYNRTEEEFKQEREAAASETATSAAEVEAANAVSGPRGQAPSGLSPEALAIWKKAQQDASAAADSSFFGAIGDFLFTDVYPDDDGAPRGIAASRPRGQ